jgi:hypothetical protein
MAFANAKSLKASPTAAKAKKEKEVVELANVKQLAHLHALSKAVTGAIKAIESTLKEDAMEMFLDRACALGAKPDSVDAVEDEARVNVQFRKRSTLSPFSIEELRNMANALKIPHDHIQSGDSEEAQLLVQLIEEKTGIEIPANVKTQQLYAIDPALAEDETLMKKVEKVLEKAGLGHIMVLQEEVKTYVCSDALMQVACSKKVPDLIRPMATLAFKPTLDEVDPKKLLKTASEVLDVSISVDGDEKKVEELVRVQAQSRSKKTKKTAALLAA